MRFGFNAKMVQLKEQVEKEILSKDTCFNAKMVQLKVDASYKEYKFSKAFQCQNGTIKSYFYCIYSFLIYFGFNAKMVQLKDNASAGNITFNKMFQCQNGTIKSAGKYLSGHPKIKFQCQNGTIKRLLAVKIINLV